MEQNRNHYGIGMAEMCHSPEVDPGERCCTQMHTAGGS